MYKIDVTKVYDGDTITADIHLGFGVVLVGQKIRLLGLDTPEVRGEERPEGLKVRDDLREKIADGARLLPTEGFDKCKYGRWLGTIFAKDGENLNEWLLSSGRACPM